MHCGEKGRNNYSLEILSLFPKTCETLQITTEKFGMLVFSHLSTLIYRLLVPSLSSRGLLPGLMLSHKRVLIIPTVL